MIRTREEEEKGEGESNFTTIFLIEMENQRGRP
jgi:hypothetical protein